MDIIRLILCCFLIISFGIQTESDAEYQIYAFQGDVAVFKQSEKLGLRNKDNDIVCPAIYDEILPFGDHDYTICCRKDLYGILDKKGKEVIECEWGSIKAYFAVGLILAAIEPDDEEGFLIQIDTGKAIHNFQKTPFIDFSSDGYYAYRIVEEASNVYTEVYGKQGNFLWKQKGYIYASFAGGRLACAVFCEEDSEVSVVIDEKGREVFRVENGDIQYIDNDGYVYYYREGYPDKHLYGVFKNNTVLLETEMPIWSLSAFTGGFPHMSNDWYLISYDREDTDIEPELDQRGYTGFIDGDGNVVIPPIYDYATPFIDNKAAVCMNDEWYIINTDNKRIGEAGWRYSSRCYSYFVQPFINDWCFMPVGEKQSIRLVDRSGHWKDEEIFTMGTIEEDYAILRDINDRICLLLKNGTLIRCDRSVHSYILPDIKNNIWWVRKNGKWGCLSLNDSTYPTWVTYPSYDELITGSGSIADCEIIIGRKGNEYHYLTPFGKCAGPAKRTDTVRDH